MRSSQSRVIRLIDWYQRAADGRPSPCRFTPSCSSYGREALELHGSRRGLWLTVRRLLRCRPFGPSGFDPVPLPGEHRRRRHHHGRDALSTAPSATGPSREGLMSQ